MRHYALSFLTLALAATSYAALDASSPFQVFPGDVNLTTARDRQSLVVRITEANGVHRNVTADAKFTLADPTKAKIENGVVYPLADGTTTLKVEFGGQATEVQVKVEQAQVDPPISFRR